MHLLNPKQHLLGKTAVKQYSMGTQTVKQLDFGFTFSYHSSLA